MKANTTWFDMGRRWLTIFPKKILFIPIFTIYTFRNNMLKFDLKYCSNTLKFKDSWVLNYDSLILFLQSSFSFIKSNEYTLASLWWESRLFLSLTSHLLSLIPRESVNFPLSATLNFPVISFLKNLNFQQNCSAASMVSLDTLLLFTCSVDFT